MHSSLVEFKANSEMKFLITGSKAAWSEEYLLFHTQFPWSCLNSAISAFFYPMPFSDLEYPL